MKTSGNFPERAAFLNMSYNQKHRRQIDLTTKKKKTTTEKQTQQTTHLAIAIKMSFKNRKISNYLEEYS